jgi:hypothetical protein
MTIYVVVVVVVTVWGCPCPTFISKGVGVTKKVFVSVTILILVGLYLYSFLITGSDLNRVGLYLYELSCRHLVVTWAYADPPWVYRVISVIYSGYVSLTLGIHMMNN